MRRLPFSLYILLIPLAVFLSWFLFSAFVFRPFGEPVTVSFSSAPSLSQVASGLSRARIIRFAFSYRLYGMFDGAARRPKAGTYAFRQGTSYQVIARALALGPARREASIQIIEGKTIDEMGEFLHNSWKIDPVAWTSMVGRSANRGHFLGELRLNYPFLRDFSKDRSLEGYLFPDTYRVWEDQLPEGLVRKQLDEFMTRFGRLVPGKELAPLQTLDEVVILASLLEREVRDSYDRRVVAGIFLSRMREGMALQSDATLNYVLDSNRTRATAQDLREDSLFNSYKHLGLPPSPICNPSASAFDAALHPVFTSYRFFLTDREGKVYYAKTYEEHLRNKRKAGY